MTDQITLEEALKLVDFEFIEGAWRVKTVKCDVLDGVWGTVYGSEWQFVKTPNKKLKRLRRRRCQ